MQSFINPTCGPNSTTNEIICAGEKTHMGFTLGNHPHPTAASNSWVPLSHLSVI